MERDGKHEDGQCNRSNKMDTMLAEFGSLLLQKAGTFEEVSLVSEKKTWQSSELPIHKSATVSPNFHENHNFERRVIQCARNKGVGQKNLQSFGRNFQST